jgi:hypothetical protein
MQLPTSVRTEGIELTFEKVSPHERFASTASRWPCQYAGTGVRENTVARRVLSDAAHQICGSTRSRFAKEVMAKGYTPDTTGEVEVQIVKLKVKGATPDLIDSLKNVAAALSGNVATVPAPRALRSVNTPGVNGASGNGAAQDEYVEEEDEQTIEQAAEPSKPRRAPAKRKIRALKLIEDLSFDGKTMSLQDFMDQYNFEDKAMRRYLGIAAWFKEQGPGEDITINHIYTAYRSLGWTDMPDNPSQPLADAANQKNFKWISAGEKSGSYHINHVGEKKLATFRKAA